MFKKIFRYLNSRKRPCESAFHNVSTLTPPRTISYQVFQTWIDMKIEKNIS